MPSVRCKCGRMTNSTTSNYWDKKGKPNECYVAFGENGGYVKGCAYDKVDCFMKVWCDHLLNLNKVQAELGHDPEIPEIGD
jgi:hypothetical protein